jgi:hypothetical protein
VYIVIVFLLLILPMLLISSKLKRNLIIAQKLTRNYATHDLELAAIIQALNMWRHYLMGNILN